MDKFASAVSWPATGLGKASVRRAVSGRHGASGGIAYRDYYRRVLLLAVTPELYAAVTAVAASGAGWLCLLMHGRPGFSVLSKVTANCCQILRH